MPELHYVILRHEGIADPHFDLLFETAQGSELAAWRSPDWPVTPATTLTPLPLHRRAYLTYEGPISDNRGHVRRIHSGTHNIQQLTPAALVTTTESGQPLTLPFSR